MKLYNQIIQVLLQMVQWFKLKANPKFRLLNLNDQALSELQQKNFERLVHHKSSAGTEIMEDIIFINYQRELIAAHKIPHNDHYGFARHLGRTDALAQMIRLIETAKTTVIKQEKITKAKPIRTGYTRPII